MGETYLPAQCIVMYKPAGIYVAIRVSGLLADPPRDRSSIKYLLTVINRFENSVGPSCTLLQCRLPHDGGKGGSGLLWLAPAAGVGLFLLPRQRCQRRGPACPSDIRSVSVHLHSCDGQRTGLSRSILLSCLDFKNTRGLRLPGTVWWG